ncbi:MAG TPA: hypothetical protein DCQ94_15560 [Nitrospira sp.]|nr:hypothetical protein [Nitrospira sp.]
MDIKKLNEKLDRKALKAFFVKNAIPTEGNFKDLIDGMLNQKDDGIVKLPDEPLSLQAEGSANSQKKVINFYGNFADLKPAWTLSLNPRVDPKDPASATRPGWSIGDADGNSRLFIDQNTGNVGIGTSDPQATLEVSGLIKASDIRFGTGGRASSNQGGSFELGDSLVPGVTPYIDFHYGTGSQQDHNMRIINDASGRLSINGGNLIVTGGNVGIGTDSPAGQLHIQTGGTGNWDKFVVKTTNLWGDGYNQYVTIGEGGANGIMFHNPHVVWMAPEGRASIRMGRSGGVSTGHWWDVGVRNGNAFSIMNGDTGVTGLFIDSGGKVGIGTSDPKAKLDVDGKIKAGSILSKPELFTFKVEGDVGKFYPIVFRDDGWDDGPMILEITRPNVHTDQNWLGSLNSKFTCHSTAYGHGADFIRAEIYCNVQQGKQFIAGYKNIDRDRKLVVWLRGQTTYQWRANQFVVLEDQAATEKTVAEENLPIKDAVDSYVQCNGIDFDKNLTVTGDLTVGARGSGSRIRVRHIDGKDYRSDNDDALYLNWNTGKTVVIGRPEMPAALSVWGNLKASNLTVMGDVCTLAADRKDAKDIKPLNDSFKKLMSLEGNRFSWTDEAFGTGEKIGVFADEVMRNFPEIVSTFDGKQFVNYQGLIPVLIEAVKAQEAKISSINRKIDDIEKGKFK